MKKKKKMRPLDAASVVVGALLGAAAVAAGRALASMPPEAQAEAIKALGKAFQQITQKHASPKAAAGDASPGPGKSDVSPAPASATGRSSTKVTVSR